LKKKVSLYIFALFAVKKIGKNIFNFEELYLLKEKIFLNVLLSGSIIIW